MEPDQRFRADAVDCSTRNRPLTREGSGRIDLTVFLRPVGAVASGIASDDMEIDFMAGAIGEYKVSRPRVITRNLSIAATSQRRDCLTVIHLFNHDVEVGVGPRVSPEASVHRPASVNPHMHAGRIHLAEEGQHISTGRLGHLAIVARCGITNSHKEVA